MTNPDTETDYGSAVAVIGMAGRFPGARSVAELWHNLQDGVKGLREYTDEELIAAGADPGQLADPRYVRVGGSVPDPDLFDASVFGINPREAATMNPQHRLFLETSWESLESAGYCPTEMPGQVGVFAGSGFPDYIVQNISHMTAEPGGGLLIAVGNERDSLASLVSYKLGLRGPSIGVQTFCSTSMVAVHLACQSLLTYECDVAIAGGTFIPLPQPSGYLYEQGGITSPDGVVRSFDAEANGTVMGSGVGAVTLKRMSEAIADGDIIHSVILGSATNNDGRVRAGYTAPGVDGEAEVIELALGVAGVKPNDIGYVECHATGTSLGDSIELAALNRVFATDRETPCVLSTLKPSIGHLDRASGVAGLMRASLQVKHGLLPGTPNYSSPNQALAGVPDRFTVLSEHQAWPEGPEPRRAGVSSFGLGGTNAHVVLEQPPVRPERPHRQGPHLLSFSAISDAALSDVTDRLRAHLIEHPEQDLADVAYTLQVSRGGFALRRAVVVTDLADAVDALADASRWIDGKTSRRNPKVSLAAGPEVSDEWLTALATELARLTERTAAGDPASTLTALGEAFTGWGIRLVTDDAEAEPVLVAPATEESAASWLLATLARLWQAGCTIDWPALHLGQGWRVELPTYAFQRHRYWVEPKEKGNSLEPASTGRTFDRSQWTYLPGWQLAPRSMRNLDEEVRLAGPWLAFVAEERGEAVVERLLQAGAEVITVRPGESFDLDDAGDYTIRVNESEDYAALIQSLLVSPRAILHGFSLASPAGEGLEHFAAEQERGFYSVLALASQLVDETGMAPRAELVLLTAGASGVVGSDLQHPEHSGLSALGVSLAQENPRLRCRTIDVDPVPDAHSGALDQLAGQVLTATVTPHDGPVAVRSGELWLRRYQPYPTAELTDETRPIQHGDTVLITGGLGDIGLLLGRHFAANYGCKLVLTARSPLPDRADWEQWLAEPPADSERTVRHIRNILDLEERGAEVLAMSADVGDEASMQAVVDAAVAKFGKIDVVVHGAGVQDDRFFNFAHLLDRVSCEAHFAAKVAGFQVLQKVLGDQAADRRLTMSSIAAILGGMALSVYAAANAALDGYVRQARRSDEGRWISINWDTWNITAERLEGHGPGVTDYAMSPPEAIDTFERVLAAGADVGHLVISTGSLTTRLETWVTGDLHGSGDDDDADLRERHPRPDLGTPFVQPAEGAEATLAEIWSRVLGIEPIGALDNFFELGGHSLIAIDLTARIRKAFGALVPVTGLLECPTVRQLAVLLTTGGAESGEASESSDGAEFAESSEAPEAETAETVQAEASEAEGDDDASA